MEDQIRKIVREEIARALGAVGAVAKGVWDDAEIDSAEEAAAQMLRRTMERVARDVLANVHPSLEPEHTASTAACTCPCRACFGCTEDEHTASVPSTEPVHTITAVPERARAACTCHRHTHVMGHDDRCGAPFCYCLSPVRARAKHTITENSGECTTCGHRPHAAGECEWWGENPCLCTKHTSKHNPGCGHTVCDGWSDCRSRTGVEPEHTSTEPPAECTVCEHAPHGDGQCQRTIPQGEAAFQCTCRGTGVHTSTGSRITCTECGTLFPSVPALEAHQQNAGHTSTEPLDYNRACTVCEHGEHDQGKCGMHVYLRGVASPCPCLASRTLGAQASTAVCTYCDHEHPQPSGDCDARVGKQQCPCPFAGGRP